MSRKSLLCAFAIVLLGIGGTVTTLAMMIVHEPEFYQRVSIPEGEQRKQGSGELVIQSSRLINGIYNVDKSWGATFTEAQLNSYFDEDFLRQGAQDSPHFPDGVSSPRVALEQDRLRLAFRYGGKRWSTVVSLDLRIWVAAKAPNVVALEVQQMRIGALPITLQSILERFSEAVRRQDIDMTWYRHNGNPVALLRFGSGRSEPSVQLLQIQLQPGALTVRGGDRSRTPVTEQPAPATAAAAKS